MDEVVVLRSVPPRQSAEVEEADHRKVDASAGFVVEWQLDRTECADSAALVARNDRT
jgi:hypothetical protein